MSVLKVLLLGTPEVTWGERPVLIQRRVPRKLLYFLAVHRNPVSRAELTAMFWPEMDDISARANLRDNLSKLRAALPDPALITSDNIKVALDSKRVYVDLIDFQNILDGAGRSPWLSPDEKPLPLAVYNDLSRAVSLWRTSHFMEGASLPENNDFEEWMQTIDRQSSHLFLRVLERLVKHCTASGDHKESVSKLRIMLDLDPYNEEYHFQLVRALDLIGNRKEALEHGMAIQQLFHKELNEPLSKEMNGLIDQLRRTNIGRTNGGNRSEKKYSEINTPLIGQGEILENLEDAFHKEHIIFLTGETGSGKSRVVTELCHKLFPSPELLKASCHPQQQTVPYQPLVNLLRSSFDPAKDINLPVGVKASLVRIFPEIASIQENGSALKDNPVMETSSNILESFSFLFANKVCHGATIILLDDAHWCDDSTFNVLSYFIDQGIFPQCGILIVAYDPSVANTALDRFKNDLQSRLAKRVTIETVLPMGTDGIQQLALNYNGQVLPQDLVEKIYQYTGGNPLFIIEILKSISMNIDPKELARVTFDASPTIQSIFTERLNRLSVPGKTILQTSAILGVNIDQDILEKTCSISPEEVVNALEELVNARIIEPQAVSIHKLPQYSFTQHAFRDAVINNISAPRKRLLHKRIAQALHDQSPLISPKNAAIIADHLEAAGELEKAFFAWIDAGNYSSRTFSSEEGMKAYSRAGNLIHSLEILLTDDQILSLFAPWISTAYTLNETAILGRIARELVTLGKQRNSSMMSGYGYMGLSDEAFALNKFAEAASLIDEALLHFNESAFSPGKLHCTARKGAALYMTGQFRSALEVLTQGLAFESIENDPHSIWALGNIHLQLAMLYTFMGYPEKGRELSEESLKYFLRAKNSSGMTDVYSIRILSLNYCGRYREALQQSDTGLEMALRLNYQHMIGMIYNFTGFVYASMGRLDKAWECAERSEKIAHDHQYLALFGTTYRLYGDIFRHLRDHKTAAEYYRKGWKSSKEHFIGLDNQSRLGYELCFTGQSEEGLQHLQQACNSAKEMGLGVVMLSSRLYEADTLFRLKKEVVSERELEEIKNDCLERGLPSQFIVAKGLLAIYQLQQGEYERTIQTIVELTKQAHDMQDPWFEISTLSLTKSIRGMINLPVEEETTRIRGLLLKIRNQTMTPQLQGALRKYLLDVDKNFR